VDTGIIPGMPKSNPETNANAEMPRQKDLKQCKRFIIAAR
jgi:hypothetical protein